MARRNYLVEGLSGVGKSSVFDELIRRGYPAISTDRAWAYHADPDTGLPGGPAGHDTWVWDEHEAVRELERPEPEVLFVCGTSRNRDRFTSYFTKVFNLRVDDDTMRRRLEARTDDDWPLGHEGVELMIELNRRGERPAGAIDVDATRPLDQIVDELLRLADLDTGFYPELRASERSTLEQFLDLNRRLIVARLDGLTEAQAGRRALPSTDLTIKGIVKHLARTEDSWFRHRLLGTDRAEPWASAPYDQDPDWDFHSGADDSIATVVALYADACERSRQAAQRMSSLDSLSALPSFGKGPVTLRWIYVHMIEETAHHAGHADLIRDAIDRTA